VSQPKPFKIRRASLAELTERPKPREVSPRERARREREAVLGRALNQAASLPASMAIVIEPEEGEKLSTIRLSLKQILDAEPRDLHWGVRGNALLITKGALPGVRRGG
jgi:hypothetical protein